MGTAWSGHARMGLDSATIIYAIEKHPRYGPECTRLLAHLNAGRATGVLSCLVLTEVLTRPYMLGADDLRREYLATLTEAPGAELVPVDATIADVAAQLRARHGLRTPDAVHAATALCAGATVFVTNDRAFERLRGEIAVVVLDDVVPADVRD